MASTFSLFDRYVLKQVALTFFGMLIAMTVLIVCVVALQELDVVTNQGAALLTFAFLTMLSLPALVSVVAPIAFFLALLLVLNRLSAESEIVVVNASGGSPMSLARPIITVALLVSVLVGVVGHLVAPPAQRAWRFLVSDVRADLLATVVREGAFSSLQEGLTFHMRAREPGGILADIMIADTRGHPEEMLYFAQRGTIVRGEEGAFLSVEDGVIQRRTLSGTGRVNTAYLYFDSYSIDLSFAERSSGPGHFKPSERSSAYLFNPDTDDHFWMHQRGRFMAELHNRMALPLFPLAFALIVTVALGTPHSARSGRGKRVLIAIAAGAALQASQFGISGLISSVPVTWPLLYLLPIGVVLLCWAFLTRRLAPEEFQNLFFRLLRRKPKPSAVLAGAE
ncbi:MAG: LPS export ABC transporter permease LptF [Hyphomicrobiales bacterium]